MTTDQEKLLAEIVPLKFYDDYANDRYGYSVRGLKFEIVLAAANDYFEKCKELEKEKNLRHQAGIEFLRFFGGIPLSDFVCGSNPKLKLTDSRGCGKKFACVMDIYRCVECDGLYHKDCLHKHCESDVAHLKSANAELVEALKPFAKVADISNIEWTNNYVFIGNDGTPILTLGDCRLAAATLAALNKAEKV